MDLIKFHYFSNYYLSRRKFSFVSCVGLYEMLFVFGVRTLCFHVILIISFGERAK